MNNNSFKSPSITTKPILVSVPKIKKNKKKVDFKKVTSSLYCMFLEEGRQMEYEASAMNYINFSQE